MARHSGIQLYAAAEGMSELYQLFEDLRKRREPLPEGKRWLTQDDVLQAGDEYAGNYPHWWVIGGEHTDVPPGIHVPDYIMCYTPRGDIRRENE